MKKKILFSLLIAAMFPVSYGAVIAKPVADTGTTRITLKQDGVFVAKMSIWWDSPTTGHYYHQTYSMGVGGSYNAEVPNDATNVGFGAFVFGGASPDSRTYPQGVKWIGGGMSLCGITLNNYLNSFAEGGC